MSKKSPLIARVWIAVILWPLANITFSAPDDLSEAAQEGDLTRVQALLESSPTDLDVMSRNGMTALLWATQDNDLSMMQVLLEAGADANLSNRYGITPLWLAALNHSATAVKLLLEFDADASATMPHGETALMAAARAGAEDAIDLLLAAGADPNVSESSQGETALMWAAAENHPEAIRRLVNGGADPDAHALALELAPMEWIQVGMVSTILPVGGWTAAMYAARQNSMAAVLTLAELGANLDEQDQDGSTALALALMNSHYDLAAALIEAGANPSIADRSGMNALYGAVDMVSYTRDVGRPSQPQFETLKALDLVRIILAKGLDPDTRLSSRVIGRHHGFGDFVLGEGATALMRAAKHNDLESMRLLLEAGANPDLELENGTTAFILVSKSERSPGNEEAQNLLLEFARNKQKADN